MRNALSLLLILSLLIFPAFADESASDVSEPVTVESITTEEEGVTVNVTITQPVESTSEVVQEDSAADPVDSSSLRTFSVTQPDILEAAQSGDDVSVMADVIADVLGEYQRQTYTVQELDAEGNVIATSTEYVPGLAGLDYHWLAGAVMFALFLSGIFKLLGGLIRL